MKRWKPLRLKPIQNTIRLLALSAAILVLSSCESAPPVTFKDFSDNFAAQKIDLPERVKFDFQASCCEEDRCGEFVRGDCVVKVERLGDAERTITKLNDTVEHWIKANNTKLESLIHSEYFNQKLLQAYTHLEKQNKTCELVSIGKKILLGTVCGVLLGTK